MNSKKTVTEYMNTDNPTSAGLYQVIRNLTGIFRHLTAVLNYPYQTTANGSE